ncbi:MAG: hypothetical protein LYZ69_01005 [Nitrososphaerales archaeon]|nr:hypothetical protein [Nitrososphaerales archaeon]
MGVRRYNTAHRAEVLARKKQYRLMNQARISEQRTQARLLLREKLFDILGGPHCVGHDGAGCPYGCTDKKILQFDHKDGDGSTEVRSLGSSLKMLEFYSKNPVLAPMKLQVLCPNCNWLKRVEKMEFRRRAPKAS